MKILVCLKQTPEPETHLHWSDDGRVSLVEGARYQMSQQDAQALEWALTLAGQSPGARVEVVSLGPKRAAAVLERARGMGAAAAWHLLEDGDDDPPALTVASRLAAWAGSQGFDLILCGAQSQDAMRGQVGPYLAGLLGLRWATLAVELRLAGPGRLHLEREVEGGRRQALELDLPALVSVQSCPVEPRYPSLSNLLKAKAHPATSLPAADWPAPAPRTQILGARRPQRRRAGRALTGGVEDQARELLAILRERGLLS